MLTCFLKLFKEGIFENVNYQLFQNVVMLFRYTILLLILNFNSILFADAQRKTIQNDNLYEWYTKVVTARNSNNHKKWHSDLDSLGYYASHTQSPEWKLKYQLEVLEFYFRQANRDTLNYLIERASYTAEELSKDHDLVIKLLMRTASYQLSWGEKSSEGILKQYEELLNKLERSTNFSLRTELLGRISLIYSSRGELAQAMEYNQLEIETANRSLDTLEIAKSLITELNLSYQLIPRPIQAEDVRPLIDKGEYLIQLMVLAGIEDILPFAKLFLAKFYMYALDYQQGKELLLSINDSIYGLNVQFSKYEQLCDIAMQENNLGKYHQYLMHFKSLAYQTNRPFVELNAHNHLLNYFLQIKNDDSASFYAAKLEANLKEVDTNRFLDYLILSYGYLADYYQGKDPLKESFNRRYKDKINQQIIQKQKEVMKRVVQYRSEADLLKDENQRLIQSIGINRNSILLLILILSTSIALLIFFFRRYSRSKEVVNRLEEEKENIIQKTERKYLLLNNKKRLYLDTIIYLKSDGNYVDFFTMEKRFTDRNRLSQVVMELPPNFIQVHRSFVVNKNFIISKNSSRVFLENGNEVPVSRTYKLNLD